ncbi:FAD-dependent oxidoreductase, partial [Devosia sp.]|uniref:dihydrolipoyl dehydrogenase family protein n=1 Tax=Devosia sp. TaxID=1871048 RepID=UPI001AC892D0
QRQMGGKDELVLDYREKKYDSLLGGQFAVREGNARFIDPKTVEIDGQPVRGERFLVATGSRPHIPDIDGLETVTYLTSDLLARDEGQELTDQPASLLIVGGGYIALELGQMFARFGTEVTLVERSRQLLAHGYEPELGRTMGQIFAEEGIVVLPNAAVQRVRADAQGIAAEVTIGSGRRTLHAERILVATGRRPNTDGIGLEAAGVAVNARNEIAVDAELRTKVPHIFAAGDVIGGEQSSQMATPVGARQGGIAAHNALAGGHPRSFDGRVIPRVIFTDPPVAVVGMTETEAVAAGHHCWCRPLPMSVVPRANAIRDTRGIIKMVADADTSEVLGVAMIGANASEVIHEAAMAMRFRAKLADFVDLLHVYPTMAEVLKIAAISRTKDPAKLSCCAE